MFYVRVPISELIVCDVSTAESPREDDDENKENAVPSRRSRVLFTSDQEEKLEESFCNEQRITLKAAREFQGSTPICLKVEQKRRFRTTEITYRRNSMEYNTVFDFNFGVLLLYTIYSIDILPHVLAFFHHCIIIFFFCFFLGICQFLHFAIAVLLPVLAHIVGQYSYNSV